MVTRNTRFQNYRRQNIQNNTRTRHGNLRSIATSFDRSRVLRIRGRQQRHPYYFRNSWSRRPFSEQHNGSRNLRNTQLNRNHHGENIDRNPNVNHCIPLQPGFSNPSQLLNAYYYGHGIPDQQHWCPCCQNIPPQHRLATNAQPLTRGYQLPNGYGGTSSSEQALEINYGRESDVSEEDLAENYVYEPSQENLVPEEDQRTNRQGNIIHLHIDLYFETSPLPVGSSAEDFDGHEDEDQHEDLEERSNNDGLTVETVLECLNTKIHNKSANQEPEICVVCLNEFEENEILGHLDCGHEYHVECITRWLLHKNFCPVCKRTAILAAGM